MGQLKPGATYVYERADGVTYAREIGAHPGDRFPIGWDANAGNHKGSTLFGMPMTEVAELVAMAQSAKTNPALQDALDRVKILYELTKPEERELGHTAWHPV